MDQITKRRDAELRKAIPVYTGFIKYFPDAIQAVANLSYRANEQHNPGSTTHWDRSKSGDEKDALMRHLIDAGTYDTDGVRHSAKVAWRALANLQKEIEEDRLTECTELQTSSEPNQSDSSPPSKPQWPS
jgi:hypothetical protein